MNKLRVKVITVLKFSSSIFSDKEFQIVWKSSFILYIVAIERHACQKVTQYQRWSTCSAEETPNSNKA